MILVDLNVILDVVQNREPHFGASSALLDLVVDGSIVGIIPAHGVTTIHYIIQRYQGIDTANRVVGWLLEHFGIGAVGKEELSRARDLNWEDFEDAVTAVVAELSRCDYIVTRDLNGFLKSKTRFLTPEELLVKLKSESDFE